MPISMPTTWVVTIESGIGEEDPDIIVALSHYPPSSCSRRRTYRDTLQRGRPPSQDERELIPDRQSSQRLPGAATSPIVASSPDGRGAAYSSRHLSCPTAPTVTP